MSEPIRYTQNIKCVEPSYLAQNIQSGMVECSIGEWVLHSDYARLKDEVERLRKATEWQPIETAPRDGTEIFACVGKYGFEATAFYSGRWNLSNDDDGYAWPYNPTHWMPIPQPPTK